jgi:hypothetical protein
MTSLLRTFTASSTTGCADLHGSLTMKESIVLNKNEMVSFYWVDVSRLIVSYQFSSDLLFLCSFQALTAIVVEALDSDSLKIH